MATSGGWVDRYFEDFTVGDVYRHAVGRTVSEADNTWFTLLTVNTQQLHFNRQCGEQSEFGRMLVNSCLTLAIVTGLTVADVTQHVVANLGWDDVRMPHPVFVGDTLWAETKVTSARESASRPSCGIVSILTRGINQRREVVIEFARSFIVFKRDAPEIADAFPVTETDWTS